MTTLKHLTMLSTIGWAGCGVAFQTLGYTNASTACYVTALMCPLMVALWPKR